MARGALLIALPAIFAMLFSAFAQLYYLPAPAMLMLGVIFLLLGLMLIVLTVRQGESGCCAGTAVWHRRARGLLADGESL